MVEVVSGNIFEDSAQVSVNPVNCVGVAGAGLAWKFKNRYPKANKRYLQACKDNLLAPGRVFPTFCEGKVIIHFPTKVHWQDPSRLDWIQSGLVSMHRHLDIIGWDTVACPALGCGLGELDFKDVLRAIVQEFENTDYKVKVYRPW